MEKLEKIRVDFGKLLQSGLSSGHFGKDCRTLGVLPGDLGAFILKETGFTGQEIVDSYVSGICIGDKFY